LIKIKDLLEILTWQKIKIDINWIQSQTWISIIEISIKMIFKIIYLCQWSLIKVIFVYKTQNKLDKMNKKLSLKQVLGKKTCIYKLNQSWKTLLSYHQITFLW
jgi:uncharacterized membrane protein YqjE